MFVTPALAQAAGGASGIDLISSMAPILMLIVIFWLLIFRPQQKRQKAHRAMLEALHRGDTVVTNGGMVAKIVRVREDSSDLDAEIADGVKVKIVRSMISEVRSKSEPVNDNRTK